MYEKMTAVQEIIQTYTYIKLKYNLWNDKE